MFSQIGRYLQTLTLGVAHRGQGLTEYVLVLALVAVLAIGAAVFVRGGVEKALSNVAAALNVTNPNGGTPGPQPTLAPPPPADYSTKKTCQTAGYQWVVKTKTSPAHCQ
jgi:Flp pilus assembly pilin Flp